MVKQRSSRNRQRAGRSRAPNGKVGQNATTQRLDQLVELQRASETKFVPEIRDVPRIRFSPRQIYNFETSYTTTIVTNSTAPTVGAFTFRMSNLPNPSSYAAVFDSYRIIQVNVKFLPFATAALTPMPGSGAYLYTVIDYDDGVAPSSQAQLLTYGTLKITPGGVIDERTLVPRAAATVYQSTTSAYAQTVPGQWMDCAYLNIEYYGLKYAFSTSPTAENVNVIITYSVQFKSQRSS